MAGDGVKQREILQEVIIKIYFPWNACSSGNFVCPCPKD